MAHWARAERGCARLLGASDMEEDQSGDLLARWREGDQRAASELFRRYADRLIALARSRLPAEMARRIDAEDVVQSVYRSFFANASDGHYALERGGDLWKLLVTITLHKLYHQVEKNSAGKRAILRERSTGDDNGFAAQVLAREPSPVEALALADELELLMRRLGPLERRMLELRLQGYTLEEIADQTQRSLRSVCRVLDEVKQLLESRRG
jgi:RNA polymerase sigma-70 factor (ECF subfamily)